MFRCCTPRDLVLRYACAPLILALTANPAAGADPPRVAAEATAQPHEAADPSAGSEATVQAPNSAPTSDTAADGAAADAAAKQQILQSEAWKAAMNRLDEWLSVQVAYRPEEIDDLQQRMRAKVAAMSSGELQEFLHQMDEKLNILHSPQGVQARRWANQYLELLSDARAAEFRQRIPDVVNMTAAQISDALVEIQQIQADKATRSAQFDKFRQAEVQAANARDRAQAQAAAAARAATPASGNLHPGFYRSSYAPRQPVQRYPGVGTGSWHRGWGW